MIMLEAQSLFSDPNPHATQETFTTLLEKSGVKIERIASNAQASAAGFWYDQPQDEWVMMVRGKAVLEVQEQSPLTLKTGDYLHIPAHTRHRVAETSADCLWLAVHLPSPFQASQ